jgi:outer membrane protein OmpA-like peptidoglycan-associated protein
MAAGDARADYSNRVGIMLGGGAYKLAGGSIDNTRVGPWATLGVRFAWTQHVDIEASYRYGFNWDITNVYRTRTTGVDIGLLYNGRPEGWTWQVFGGSGVFWWNVMDFRAIPAADPDDPDFVPPSGFFDTAPTPDGFREDGNGARLLDSNWKVYVGLGAEVPLAWRFTLRGGLRLDYLIRQYTDNAGLSDTLRTPGTPDEKVARARSLVDANDLVPSAFAAVTYWFGERDRDNDGIADKSDACPDEPEDMDAFSDEDGCPDLDNDSDGVADATDKCPNEAEDRDAFEDEDGCPDGDNDKDGVADATDRCPAEAEDIDQFQDDDGCPEADNDGDGVPDGGDQCSNTPPGARVDEKGCTVVSAYERQLLATGTIVLSGIKFDPGKSTVKPEFAARFDTVAVALAAYPTLRIEIGGHTDASGSDAVNMRLSQQRAQGVLDYLKGKYPTADASRFTVRGYGESVPIASNATKEGQAANRRVEFKVLNREVLDAEVQKRTGEGKPPAAPGATPAPAEAAPLTPGQPPATPPAKPPTEAPPLTLPPLEPVPAPPPPTLPPLEPPTPPTTPPEKPPEPAPKPAP